MSNELIKYNLCACKCVWNLEYCFCFLHVYYMHRDVKSAKEKKGHEKRFVKKQNRSGDIIGFEKVP